MARKTCSIRKLLYEWRMQRPFAFKAFEGFDGKLSRSICLEACCKQFESDRRICNSKLICPSQCLNTNISS